jgi:antitoxin HicB
MLFQYPVALEQNEDGVIARFVDVPEAITFGDDEEHALHEAQDALVVALAMYIDDRQVIPSGSKPRRGQPLVCLNPLVAAKVALHNALIESKISNVRLASMMGLRENQIRRMLDLDHQSHIRPIEHGLRLLGYELIMHVSKVA